MPAKHVYCNNPYISMGQPCKENKCSACHWMEYECDNCNDTGVVNGTTEFCSKCNASMIVEKYLIYISK